MVIRAVRVCEQPTRKFPEGRTGTDAGYGAHRYVNEVPCEACQLAHKEQCQAVYSSRTPDQVARRRETNRIAVARYRAENPDAVRGKQQAFIQRNKATMRAAKSDPCADCGISYPYYVMQFDHVRDEKAFNIGLIGPSASRARLLAEIAKCDVVCANCHSERSHKRLMQKLGRSSEAI